MRLLELARQAAEIRVEDAPEPTRLRLFAQSLSVLGATAAGRQAADAAAVLAAARAEGQGALGVAPGVSGLALSGALLAGSALSVAHDYDDWLLCGHCGHTSHWLAWLGAAERGLGWEAALSAQLAANELMGRLGGFCLAGPQNGQSWAFLHAAGAALIESKLRGLPPKRAAHAVAIALSQAPFVDWRGFHSGAKLVLAALPALSGVRAAALAEAGLEGPLDLLEEGSDFVRIFANGKSFSGWLTGVGRAWLTDTLALKLVPGCAYLGSAVEAMRRVMDEAAADRGRPLRAADVLRVDVDAGVLTVAMETLLAPPPEAVSLDPVGLHFSTARSLALLLLRGSLEPADFALDVLATEAAPLAELASRIHVHHELRMTLDSWSRMRDGLGIDRLLAGYGPAQALGRAGIALADLPLSMVSDGLAELEDTLPGSMRDLAAEIREDPATALSRRIGAVAGWAGRTATRIGGRLGSRIRDAGRPYDLADHDLPSVALPIPARVRLLEHGGRVREAELLYPAGSPGRPWVETAAGVRGKFLAGAGALSSPARRRDVRALCDALLAEDGAAGELPAGGPREFLGRWSA